MIDLNLSVESTITKEFKSKPQKARIITEKWLLMNAYCPSCGQNLTPFTNNHKFGDFFCQNCKEDFELKSKSGQLSHKIVDGAYSVISEKIKSCLHPNLFVLTYCKEKQLVNNLFVIPKHFLHLGIIEIRKPLSDKARRKGWVGCNININTIPKSGWIYLIKDYCIVDKHKVLDFWNTTLFLRSSSDLQQRTWILDVLLCIERIGKDIFTLEEVYEFEAVLSQKHPNNFHIKDKIRQQLQYLRDKNYIKFIGKGLYKKLK